MSDAKLNPNLKIDVTATLVLSNQTQVEINEGYIIFEKPGPRGGSAHRIVIPRGQWPSIVQAVERVQDALSQAERMKSDIEGRPQ